MIVMGLVFTYRWPRPACVSAPRHLRGRPAACNLMACTAHRYVNTAPNTINSHLHSDTRAAHPRSQIKYSHTAFNRPPGSLCLLLQKRGHFRGVTAVKPKNAIMFIMFLKVVTVSFSESLVFSWFSIIVDDKWPSSGKDDQWNSETPEKETTLVIFFIKSTKASHASAFLKKVI